jgi:hypothetical protein
MSSYINSLFFQYEQNESELKFLKQKLNNQTHSFSESFYLKQINLLDLRNEIRLKEDIRRSIRYELSKL